MTADDFGSRSRTEKLAEQHVLSDFDCGEVSLNDWLRKYSLKNQRLDSSRTYVLCRDGKVMGYYALTAGSVKKEHAGPRVAKGMPPYDIPIILLARLAIDKTAQGQNKGAWLLRDALQRCLNAADEIGARAVLVHALHEGAKKFYLHFDFEECPAGPLQLMLLMQDLRLARASHR
jgi:GNAT superfamily N-acetyltransferase